MPEGEPKEQPKLSEKEIQDKLIQEYGEKYQLAFHYSKDRIDLTKLKLNYHYLEEIGINVEQLKKDIADLITFYNQTPIITDNFKDHEVRQEWQGKIEEKYGNEAYFYIKNNKLSTNSLTLAFSVFSYYEAKIDEYQNTSLKTKIIKSLIKRFEPLSNHAYNKFTNEEKIKFVHKVENIIKDFIKLLQQE